MSRAISAAAGQAITSPETDEVFLVCLDIDHHDLETPIRVVNNTEDIVSGGQTYVAYPFTFVMPDDDGQSIPNAQIQIDNVDRLLVETVRTIQDEPVVTIKVVLASSPDTIEMMVENMRMTSVDYDALKLTATLEWENVLSLAFPSGKYLPSNAPGLF